MYCVSNLVCSNWDQDVRRPLDCPYPSLFFCSSTFTLFGQVFVWHHFYLFVGTTGDFFTAWSTVKEPLQSHYSSAWAGEMWLSLRVFEWSPFLSLQYGLGQDEGGRGVTTIQGLVQSFKIAERSSPGFCDDLVVRTIAQLQQCSSWIFFSFPLSLIWFSL